MIKYVESHAAKCGIPTQISDQMKAGHKTTETMQKKVCAVRSNSSKKDLLAEPERSAGFFGVASGGHDHQEGRQYLRYPERQRPRAMIGAADLKFRQELLRWTMIRKWGIRIR